MRKIDYKERVLDIHKSLRTHFSFQLSVIEDVENGVTDTYLENFISRMEIKISELKLIDKKIQSLEATRLSPFDLKSRLDRKGIKLFFRRTLSFYNRIFLFIAELRRFNNDQNL